MTAILFVCLGNICRSPLAEGVLRDRAARAGRADRLVISSAGTGAWHVGKRPDPRSIEVAARHGIDLTGQRARQVDVEDFSRFSLILAMDDSNLRDLQDLRARAPATAGARVRRFLDRDVPDPYYGGPGGFEAVYDMLAEGCDRLLLSLFDRV